MATEEEIRALLASLPVEHPLRRSSTGPSDIEWALFSQKVSSMEKTLEELVKEVKAAIINNTTRCDNCPNSKITTDHERRIRNIEQTVWKAMGIAAAAAGLLSFALEKIFK